MMKIEDTSTPVLILGCKIGALAIMRSLGSQGVRIYGVDDDPQFPTLLSKYLYKYDIMPFDIGAPEAYLDFLIRLSGRIGSRAILIPTSDELSMFAAEYKERLSAYFTFPIMDLELVRGLANKADMFKIAKQYGVPTPNTLFPKNLDDVVQFSKTVEYPLMLKGIYGNLLQENTGLKMMIVHSYEELIHYYKLMEDPGQPNLMMQEYIPGGDDQVFIFNGYFNRDADCLAGFTGYKVRQFPIHVGAASLGENLWNGTVAEITTRFMKAIGYRGILDIGYRFDPRDGQYKVLDINPRVGQAFRIFVAENGMDVIRALYLDLTDQAIPEVVPRHKRRWIIEDCDFISSFHYFKEGSMNPVEWLKSFRGLEEGAWWDLRDPKPFLRVMGKLVKRGLHYLVKKRNLGNSGLMKAKATTHLQ